MSKRAGSRFTLIELMTVVGVVSLLAAMAVPSMQTMALRAKRTEASVNYDGIGTALVAFNNTVEAEALLALGSTVVYLHPDGALPTKKAVPWVPGVEPLRQLGWGPDGDVRCRYSIGGMAGEWSVDVICNIDGDARYYSVSGAMIDGIQPTGLPGDRWWFQVSCAGAATQLWWGRFTWQQHESPCY